MSESSDSDGSDVEHVQYKVIILGDGAVGKTSIAMRHTNDHFSDVYKQTIGLDFFLNKLTLPGSWASHSTKVRQFFDMMMIYT